MYTLPNVTKASDVRLACLNPPAANDNHHAGSSVKPAMQAAWATKCLWLEMAGYVFLAPAIIVCLLIGAYMLLM